MNDKEYTYDIDKYTIGVDENGEDGIGLTVAKVENGEIYFLDNCYGENARCLNLLIKENFLKIISSLSLTYISKLSPSLIKSVFLISFGTTILPKLSIRRITPVFFIIPPSF